MKKALLWLFIVRSFVVSIFGAQEVSFPELTTEKKESVREAKVIDIANILEPIAKRYDIPSIAGLLMKGDKIVMQGCCRDKNKRIKHSNYFQRPLAYRIMYKVTDGDSLCYLS